LVFGLTLGELRMEERKMRLAHSSVLRGGSSVLRDRLVWMPSTGVAVTPDLCRGLLGSLFEDVDDAIARIDVSSQAELEVESYER
jgi:hypothetical protein